MLIYKYSPPKRKRYILLAFMTALMPVYVANAVEVMPIDECVTLSLFELFTLFMTSETAAKWITLVGFLAYIFTQLMAWLPPEWLAKLPTWVIKLIKMIAGNYRKASNGTENDPERLRRIGG
ncbi:hypothetical protein [Shewanella sp. YLB-07]|uniref:hypothetical protein n=1 Tax=Shewanella sp. YLB-07 TaxID=2601268 RepID=UPI00128D2CC1|nr:hypothetical protein [Shewanella sp. YLB-07]MPY24390.1 hypothetical protein [Shewanella sp. YLB-07]